MTALLCASSGCNGRSCPRDGHAYLGGGPSGREPQYGRCMTHGACSRFQLDELAALDVVSTTVHSRAEPAPTDSPVGADGVPGVAHRPDGDLPGTNPAPGIDGHGPAAPPAAPAVEAAVPPQASTAGQLLGSWITWHCPLHLVFVELPYGHVDCPTELIRARVTVRREDADA